MRARLTLGLALFALGLSLSRAEGPTKLKFKEDGTFRIVFLTDQHTGESAEKDKLTKELTENVLKSEPDADFVMFGGDHVTGLDWVLIQQPGFYEYHWNKLVQPVVDAGLPFAATIGNHDGEADLSRHEIMQLYQSTNTTLSHARPGPDNITGAANYWVDVYDPSGKDVALRIWVLDSMDRSCEDAGDGWGCVGKDTVAWVRETAPTLEPAQQSIAFIHIPVTEMVDMWNNNPTQGVKHEPVGCGLVNTGTFEALKDIGVSAMYFGHDHVNDYIGEYEGVRLAYGRQSGYGRYGPGAPLFPDLVRGARVIEMQLGESGANATTYIRNYKGEKEEQADSPADLKAVKQDVCASMEAKDPYGQAQCANGTHWVDSTDFNCAADGKYNAIPTHFGELNAIVMHGLTNLNVTMLLPAPDATTWSQLLYDVDQTLKAGVKKLPPEVQDKFDRMTLVEQFPYVLDLADAGEAQTVAGTTATFEFDPVEREVYGTFPQADGSSLRYRIMPYPIEIKVPNTDMTTYGMIMYQPHLSAQGANAQQPDFWEEIDWETIRKEAAKGQA